jgi:hypothetical protein
MSMDIPVTVEEARVLLKKVICQCPHQHDKDPNCQLCEFKAKAPGERDGWVDKLSDEEVLQYCQRHNRCFWEKLGDR